MRQGNLKMSDGTKLPKLVAVFQTAGICVAAEGLVFLVLTGLLGSFIAAATMSAIILGPISLVAAVPIYRERLRRTSVRMEKR